MPGFPSPRNNRPQTEESQTQGQQTEEVDARYAQLDTLPTEQVLELMVEGDMEIAVIVAQQISNIAVVVEAAAAALKVGGRMIYVGAGTSGRLGVLDASECPPTFHTPPDMVQGLIAGGPAALTRSVEAAEDSGDGGAADLRAIGLSASDFVVGIAASGRTPYVLGAVEYARQLGAKTAGLSCAANSELSAAVDFPVEIVTGAEIIAGSTRMRAGTATKMVLNMISTGAMIHMGYVYGNLMVNVQPTNQKLKQRACRIIQQVTGADEERASSLLEAAGQRVTVAIVMETKQVSRMQAEEILAAADGNLRRALEGTR